MVATIVCELCDQLICDECDRKIHNKGKRVKHLRQRLSSTNRTDSLSSQDNVSKNIESLSSSNSLKSSNIFHFFASLLLQPRSQTNVQIDIRPLFACP